MDETQSKCRVFAIVPAAGRSRRMGEPKQLIDIGGKPMLAQVLDTILAAAVEHLCLVTHSNIRDCLHLPQADRLTCAINDDETTEMIDSIRLGVRHIAARTPLGDNDGLLICPGDLPQLRKVDVGATLSAFQNRPDRIVIASRAGRRGHPIVFPASLVPFVESDACDGGLNALPRAFPVAVLEVECQSDGILHDVDTPADLNERDTQP